MLLVFLVIGEAVEDFLFGFIADRASVVENEVGFFDGLDLAIAFLDERTDDLFGVVDVNLAAEGLEVERFLCVFFWNPRHIRKV